MQGWPDEAAPAGPVPVAGDLEAVVVGEVEALDFEGQLIEFHHERGVRTIVGALLDWYPG